VLFGDYDFAAQDPGNYSAGSDFLNGENGNDTLIGGFGTNTLNGGDGFDTADYSSHFNDGFSSYRIVVNLEANSGTLFSIDQFGDEYLMATDSIFNVEEVIGTDGGDSITGRSTFSFGLPGSNTLRGRSGNDTIVGGFYADQLFGDSGNDTIHAGFNADQSGSLDMLHGGTGNDTYYVDRNHQIVELANEGVLDIMYSDSSCTIAPQVERLVLASVGSALNATGDKAANELIGNDYVNILSGLDNSDLLDGGANADSMWGGLGDDTYVVDNIGDGTLEAAGAGYDTIRSSITLALRINIEALVLTGSANINGTGTKFSNSITGNSGNNILNGLGDRDTMTGLGGNDTYYADVVDEVIVEGLNAGIDIVHSSVDFVLPDNVEKLYLTGTAATARGNALSNHLYGNNFANAFHGEGGADRLYGYDGNDNYFVDSTGNLIYEKLNEGTDWVFSSVNHTLAANVETLSLTGSSNINGTGNTITNSIGGNSGNNWIDGKLGADILSGGLGKDNFLFTTALGATNIDEIVDFTPADDTIRLDDAIFAGPAPGTLAASAFVIGPAALDASDRIIYNPAGGALLFDPDGTGAAVAMQFGKLFGSPPLTNADFFIF
jgi:Ca2+-binding RTX toxin-like protein